jgi:hypothetical protein
MTLKITSNKIYIQNTSGLTKFDSNNHLLYRYGYKSGSFDLTGSSNYQTQSLGFTINEKAIPVIYITVTYAAGSILSTMINIRLPLSGAFPSHWEGFVENSSAISLQENLELVADGDYIKARINRYDPRTFDNICGPGSKAVSFNYEVFAYKHQDI